MIGFTSYPEMQLQGDHQLHRHAYQGRGVHEMMGQGLPSQHIEGVNANR
jgi:hypothetical protein